VIGMRSGARIALLGALAAIAALSASPAAQARERTVVLRSGPYTLGSFQTIRPKVIVPSPRVDGHITQMFARLVDETGTPVNVQQVMLHHVVFINRGRFAGDRKPKCGTRFGEPFYGTGEENQRLDLPEGYGYRIRPGDKWKMQAMLMSHNKDPQRIFVEYRMRVVDQEPLTNVTPYWVRVTNCRNDPSYSVPGGRGPGAVHLRTKLWTVPQNGRIVAGGAHLHGGAHNITIRQPHCSGRRLMQSDPTYGGADHLSYRVQPLLHEPGPVNTSWWTSRRGMPVRKGERLRITAAYDAERPHGGVMGVWHVYIAPGRPPERECPAVPADAKDASVEGPEFRSGPPKVTVPLTTLLNGVPTTIAHPAGELHRFESPNDLPLIDVNFGAFSKVNLSVPTGTLLTWVFKDPDPHKVQLANGPRALGSPTLTGGEAYRRRFNVPGTYQLFCYLHPMTMHQEVEVRPGGAPVPGAGDGTEAVGDEDQGEDQGEFY